jgi:hypothetical protein
MLYQIMEMYQNLVLKFLLLDFATVVDKRGA